MCFSNREFCALFALNLLLQSAHCRPTSSYLQKIQEAYHDDIIMGLFKKLNIRSKPKSTRFSFEGTIKPSLPPGLDVPKQAISSPSLTHVPASPEAQLEAALEDDTDTGSILIGIDFGTT